MDSLYFFSALISSLFLSIFSCFLFKWKNPCALKNWKKMFKIIETKGLLSLPLFWLSFLLPFFLFITFGSIVWSGYDLSMTKEGFDIFLDISKLPLWLLAIAAPASVVIARAHGTAQTATQIKEMISNKKREIYFKYQENIKIEINNIVDRFEDDALFGEIELKIAPISSTQRENISFKATNIFPLFHIPDKDYLEQKLHKQNISNVIEQINVIAEEIEKYIQFEKDNDLAKLLETLQSLSTPARIIIHDLFHSRRKDLTLKYKNLKITNLDIYHYATLITIVSKILLEVINSNHEFYQNHDNDISEMYDKLEKISHPDLPTKIRSPLMIISEYNSLLIS